MNRLRESIKPLLLISTLSFTACDFDSSDKSSQETVKEKTTRIEKMTNKKEDEELVPLFIPALSAILMAAEEKKGSALTKEEVLSIRDNGTTIMTPKSMVKSMAEKRGYEDIDPENCWNEWQLFRASMHEENHEKNDHEAVVIDSPSDNPSMRNAEEKARQTLKEFREIIKSKPEIYPMIKVRIEDINTASRMWLFVDEVEEGGFKAHLFEVPTDFEKYKAGDRFNVKDEEILDWMINDNGEVNGAYTIRVLRDEMSEEERKKMDEHMGVSRYL